MSNFPVLSIQQFDEDGIEHEFYIHSFSDHLRKHHTNILVPHKHDFYLAVSFTRGTGWHEIDFKRHPVTPGTVFFLRPGQTHHWKFTADIEGVILFHSLSFFQLNCPQQDLADFPFFRTRQEPPFIQTGKKENRDLADSLQKILSEYQSKQVFRYSKISSMLNCFYIDSSRLYDTIVHQKTGKPSLYSKHFQQFETLIEGNFKTEKSSTRYAEWLNMSAKHLNRICKECCGLTSTEVITERVLLEAKRLLSSQEMNLNEISFELGFGEYSYFSHLFKKYTGKTPSDFQRKYKR